MSVFAISDLHLSFYRNKPMEVFGENWRFHYKKISDNWKSVVNEDDVVLIPGDISWATSMNEFIPDIKFINSFPGKKIFVQGNHDYWWKSTSKLNSLYYNMIFIKNSFYPLENFAVCGTRGWLSPNDTYFTSQDEKIYKREVLRLKNSLDLAVNSGFKNIIVMLHYPPTNDKKENSLFIETINNYPVKKVVYGHLHSEDCFYLSFTGVFNNVEYILVSADFLNFKPIKIL